jgi:hypothetical protein
MVGPTEVAQWIRERFSGTEFTTEEALEAVRTSDLVTEDEAEQREIGRNGLPSGKPRLDHVFHSGLQIGKKKRWVRRGSRHGYWFAFPVANGTQQIDNVAQAKVDRFAQARVLLHQAIDLLLE